MGGVVQRLQSPDDMTSTSIAVRSGCTVIVNTGAGDGDNGALETRLKALFQEQGLDPTLHLTAGARLGEVLASRLPAEPTLVVAAGGDGTVRAVANALAGSGHRMGILPLGTANVFARTLGVPLELEEAVRVLREGRDEPVDVCEVNGHRFLNNSAIGLYADVTRIREDRRDQHGRLWKGLRWTLDTLAASWRVLRSWRVLPVRLRLDGEELRQRVPSVIVSGNDYRGGLPGHRLGGGRLAVYVPKPTQRLPFLAVLLKAALVRPDQVETLEVHVAREVTVETPFDPTRISIDGEVRAVSGLLRFRTQEAALAVRVPATEPGAGDAVDVTAYECLRSGDGAADRRAAGT